MEAKNTNNISSSGTTVQEPTLCVSCFEFFGNPMTRTMCSKCFKEALKKEESIIKTENVSIPKIQNNTSEKPAIEESKVGEKPQQTNTNACWKCNKRVGLLGFKCRCEYTFCSNHRTADDHDCDFDYKQMDRERLEKNNPRVAASKLEKL